MTPFCDALAIEMQARGYVPLGIQPPSDIPPGAWCEAFECEANSHVALVVVDQWHANLLTPAHAPNYALAIIARDMGEPETEARH